MTREMVPSPTVIVCTPSELVEIVQAAVRHELEAWRPVDTEWLSLDDAAKVLNVCTKTVLRYARRQGLPGKSLPGGGWRFKRGEIEEWLCNRATDPGAHSRKHVARLRSIRGGNEE